MTRLISGTVAIAAICVGALGLSGCGDVVANQGNLGNLVYALFTDYNIGETELTDVKLITGVEHRIVVTEAPDADLSGTSSITHILFPQEGTTITTGANNDGGSIGDALLKVDLPGKYTLQSWKETELIDYIALEFVEATGLEVMTYLRQPDQDEFAIAPAASPSVQIYSQATFLAAPVDANGNNLVGDIGLEIAVSPEDSMIQVYNLEAVYENEIWESSIPINMVFVKTGTVDVTLTEPLTGLASTIQFTVTEPPAE